jgi:hypothetical protein
MYNPKCPPRGVMSKRVVRVLYLSRILLMHRKSLFTHSQKGKPHYHVFVSRQFSPVVPIPIVGFSASFHDAMQLYLP